MFAAPKPEPPPPKAEPPPPNADAEPNAEPPPNAEAPPPKADALEFVAGAALPPPNADAKALPPLLAPNAEPPAGAGAVEEPNADWVVELGAKAEAVVVVVLVAGVDPNDGAALVEPNVDAPNALPAFAPKAEALDVWPNAEEVAPKAAAFVDCTGGFKLAGAVANGFAGALFAGLSPELPRPRPPKPNPPIPLSFSSPVAVPPKLNPVDFFSPLLSSVEAAPKLNPDAAGFFSVDADAPKLKPVDAGFSDKTVLSPIVPNFSGSLVATGGSVGLFDGVDVPN